VKIEKMASSAEYTSIGLSCLGTIAAIATQQLAYVSAPLALSVSLSFLNRKRELSNANQHIALLEQQITSHHQSTIDRINILQQSVATSSITPTSAEQQIADIYNRIDTLDYSIGDSKDHNFILTGRVEDYQKYNLLAQIALPSELNTQGERT
jgi:cell division protein FtsL